MVTYTYTSNGKQFNIIHDNNSYKVIEQNTSNPLISISKNNMDKLLSIFSKNHGDITKVMETLTQVQQESVQTENAEATPTKQVPQVIKQPENAEVNSIKQVSPVLKQPENAEATPTKQVPQVLKQNVKTNLQPKELIIGYVESGKMYEMMTWSNLFLFNLFSYYITLDNGILREFSKLDKIDRATADNIMVDVDLFNTYRDLLETDSLIKEYITKNDHLLYSNVSNNNNISFDSLMNFEVSLPYGGKLKDKLVHFDINYDTNNPTFDEIIKVMKEDEQNYERTNTRNPMNFTLINKYSSLLPYIHNDSTRKEAAENIQIITADVNSDYILAEIQLWILVKNYIYDKIKECRKQILDKLFDPTEKVQDEYLYNEPSIKKYNELFRREYIKLKKAYVEFDDDYQEIEYKYHLSEIIYKTCGIVLNNKNKLLDKKYKNELNKIQTKRQGELYNYYLLTYKILLEGKSPKYPSLAYDPALTNWDIDIVNESAARFNGDKPVMKKNEDKSTFMNMLTNLITHYNQTKDKFANTVKMHLSTYQSRSQSIGNWFKGRKGGEGEGGGKNTKKRARIAKKSYHTRKR